MTTLRLNMQKHFSVEVQNLYLKTYKRNKVLCLYSHMLVQLLN